VTRLIIEKLLITPTEQLKSLSDADTVAAYSDALNRLFDLSGDSRPVDPPDKGELAGTSRLRRGSGELKPKP